MKRSRIVKAGVALMATLAPAAAAASPAAAAAARREQPVVWASPRGAFDLCSQKLPCGLAHAVEQARPGGCRCLCRHPAGL